MAYSHVSAHVRANLMPRRMNRRQISTGEMRGGRGVSSFSQQIPAFPDKSSTSQDESAPGQFSQLRDKSAHAQTNLRPRRMNPRRVAINNSRGAKAFPLFRGESAYFQTNLIRCRKSGADIRPKNADRRRSSHASATNLPMFRQIQHPVGRIGADSR